MVAIHGRKGGLVLLKNKTAKTALSLVFWVGLWQLLSLRLDAPLLLPSPLSVLACLARILCQPFFWQAVGFSLLRIAAGFLGGLALGVLLAALGARFSLVQALFSPVMALMKASPVASFTILLLVWIPSRNLSVAVSFLMVLPLIYTNTLAGILATDRKLLEMAALFEAGLWSRIRCIYLSQLLPFLRPGAALALGLCWKAGIAAEVIGLPAGSIGEQLHEAKVFFDTPALFAWTAAIVLLSLLLGRAFLALIDAAACALERM